MSDESPAVVVIVRPTTTAEKSRRVLGWLRWLLPAAFLILSEAPLTAVSGADRVITIDVDAVESGPLSVADALTRDWLSSHSGIPGRP